MPPNIRPDWKTGLDAAFPRASRFAREQSPFRAASAYQGVGMQGPDSAARTRKLGTDDGGLRLGGRRDAAKRTPIFA